MTLFSISIMKLGFAYANDKTLFKISRPVAIFHGEPHTE